MSDWTLVPGPTALLIYGALLLFGGWIACWVTEAAIDAKRDAERWRRSREASDRTERGDGRA